MKKKGARILVMDDEPEMVRLLQRTFIAHDFQVCTMTNAEDPLEAFMQYRPDFRCSVLMDLAATAWRSANTGVGNRRRERHPLPARVLCAVAPQN